jgi:predicted ribosomally synthesized peptide with nif11-like leader
MSIRSARNFIDRVRTDSEFKENIVSLLGTGEEIRNYIRSKGFDFDYSELQTASASVSISTFDFVSAHEMDKITEFCR